MDSITVQKGYSTFRPIYVFPVPGGPWITANSLVSAICKALYWESSSSRSSADGQWARCRSGTSVPTIQNKGIHGKLCLYTNVREYKGQHAPDNALFLYISMKQQTNLYALHPSHSTALVVPSFHLVNSCCKKTVIGIVYFSNRGACINFTSYFLIYQRISIGHQN